MFVLDFLTKRFCTLFSLSNLRLVLTNNNNKNCSPLTTFSKHGPNNCFISISIHLFYLNLCMYFFTLQYFGFLSSASKNFFKNVFVVTKPCVLVWKPLVQLFVWLRCWPTIVSSFLLDKKKYFLTVESRAKGRVCQNSRKVEYQPTLMFRANCSIKKVVVYLMC